MRLKQQFNHYEDEGWMEEIDIENDKKLD